MAFQFLVIYYSPIIYFLSILSKVESRQTSQKDANL